MKKLQHLLKPFLAAIAMSVLTGTCYADLFIRDNVGDTGIEPNPSTGAMWLSPDIWVRRNPMPGWTPRPFSSTGPAPAWLITTHEDPDYASPASGKPNYVYVRIKNKGSVSSPTDRLTLYWASASTGLSWDPAKVGGSFIDNVSGGVLFGAEITKVRKNAATASPTERAAYLAALRKIATDPAFVFPAGRSYWRTQQEIHRFGPTYRHGFNGGTAWVPSVAFLPWHREYVNRLEGMMQEADPTVKLLYWNWTDNPVTGPLNYSSGFMGDFGVGSTTTATPIGAPVLPDLNAAYPRFDNGLTTPTRRLRPGAPLAQTDATVLGRIPYDAVAANTAFSGGLESFSHNNSHVYIASTPVGTATSTSGDQLFQPYAARDPFFFFLHAKVDELWARWQRQSLNNLDPATTYGTASGNATITANMGPWDGTVVGDTLPNNVAASGIPPWTTAGGQIALKPANHRSVVSPPFYDTAPLTIPVLQPDEEVVLEIPWYPPNPANFGSVGDPAHVCLIARIETSTAPPFGMTVAETTNLNFNTQQNNNIAWRNVSVVDTFPGPFRLVRLLVENGFRAPVEAGLRLGVTANQEGGDFFQRGTVRVDLGPDLFQRWRAGGARGEGVEVLANGQLRVARPNASLQGIALKPGERFQIRAFFDLNREYRPTKPGEALIYDVVQTGTPNDPKATVGGQRYTIGLDKLTPVERGRVWRWLPGVKQVPRAWTSIDFDDSAWNERKLDLGWVDAAGASAGAGGHDHDSPDATGGGGHGDARLTTTYYFRRAFDVADPGFFRDLQLAIKRSDGAIAYLNGKEIYRINLPAKVTEDTPARAQLKGLEREAYYPVKLDPSLLRQGRNVIAVEIHRARKNQDGLTFDAEINANNAAPQQAPYAQIANLADGSLLTVGRVATVNVDAFKVDGAVRSVTFSVDDKPVQTLDRPPFTFKWEVQPGPHRLLATVTGSDGLATNTFATVTGVGNVPPVVELTAPTQHQRVPAGAALKAVARASDPDGKIARVDFFVHDSYIIGAQGRFVGSAKRPPYAVTIKGLKAGHAMVVAIAYDDGGLRTASAPVMVVVGGRDGQ